MQVLRGWSLFYRLVAVSTVAAAAMTAIALWVTSEHIAGGSGEPHWGIAIPLIVTGVAITLAVVLALTRIVLRPIEELEDSIVAFGRGDVAARARPYPFTDAQVTRLIVAFNEMADALVEKQAKLTEMSSRVIAAQEDERRRLARELHDDAGQNLTSVLLGLTRLQHATSIDELRETLPSLRERLGEALEGLRGLARALRPSVLDDLGLAAAIRSSIQEFERATPVRVDTNLDGLDGRLSPQTEIVLYRVFQEAIINVVKHANATTAKVQAERHGQNVRLSVEDDGRGFDPSAPALKERGLGLFSMAERLALVDGVLHVHSMPGKGALIVAEVPVDGD